MRGVREARRRAAVDLLVGLAVVAAALAGPPAALPGPGAAGAQATGGPARFVVAPEESEVRYRVREQLARLPLPNDAVGSTRAVEGGIAFDGGGRVLPGESRITVDLRTLQSDEPRRDGYLRRNTLLTDRHPAVTFVPREARGLPWPLPAAGRVAFELVGDLTVRDVTRPVTWAAAAQLAGPRATVEARTAIRFGDFGLPIPRVASVLSVVDEIRLEADLALRRR
jgi:polyisoprenoid-binding protein YceI